MVNWNSQADELRALALEQSVMNLVRNVKQNLRGK
jgi:hypothetical protein